ncbi:vWA domain-containing protein [Corynebacterium variabile]|uniref:vWA domain-containing protein n=1 Tax=Corynebacterium variabile TaxID=1727 RepID=UPI003A8F2825
MTTPSRRRGLRLAAALGTGALLAGSAFVGTPAAFAQDAPAPEEDPGRENIANFGSCIDASKSANVLLILDQSASLQGFDPNTKEFDASLATDPDKFRVEMARDITHQFQQLATDHDADINVKLAGFGEEYYDSQGEYGDWVNVGSNASDLESAIADFESRDKDMYTDYVKALDGASQAFAGAPSGDDGQSDCEAVFFFSDGMPTSEGMENEEAAARVCAPNSPLVALRNSGVRFFTLGLIPEGATDNPGEILERMSTGDCGGGTPNGAFADSSDPAGLVAAVRDMVPGSGSHDSESSMNDPTRFTLDNSIDVVRLSAMPTSRIDGEVTPVLTSPDGEKIPLETGETALGDASIDVRPSTTSINGEVTAELKLDQGGDWAGEWVFGYEGSAADDDRYKTRVTFAPGLSVKVDELSERSTTGLKSDGQITASLLDSEGEPRKLDGKADLEAAFVRADGTRTELGSQPIAEGTPVTFPLEGIEDAANGKIELTARITTKPTDDAPGTPLTPVNVAYPVTITPVNMPTIGTPGSLSIDDKETTVEIPVTGPGKVWVDTTTLNSGDPDVTLPDGVDSVEISSEHGKDNPLELGDGEEKKFPVTLKSSDLADGRIAVSPTIQLASADDAAEPATADVPVEMKGNMTSPVNTGVFIGALIGVLLAAILIPLAVLYLMKLYTGRIPSTPGIHAVRIPVKVENGRLIRTDKGGIFQVSFDELMGSGRTVANGRDVTLAGVPVHVKLGANPLAAPTALVNGQAPSISDEGRQDGTDARLPLAVHNHWFMLGTPGDPTSGEVVLAVDEFSTESRVNDLASQIATNGPELLERLAATPVDAPDQGKKQGGKRRKKKGDQADAVPAPPADQTWPGSGFGQADGGPTAFGGQPGSQFGSSSPFGGPASGDSSPFEDSSGQTGPSSPGTSGGGWGSDNGNTGNTNGNGGQSPFGGPTPFGN